MKKGFTLIEMLVYVAVLAILIVALSSFVLWAINSNTKTKVMRETSDSARRAMGTILYEIREAKSVYTPTTSASQLSLETTRYLPANETTSFVDFFLCSNRICIKKESQTPVALTSENVNIRDLQFTRIVTGSSASVQVSFVAEYIGPATKPQYQASISLTSTASLRSY